MLLENCLNPQETLFIDGSVEHIATVKQLGIQALHLQGETVSQFFYES